MRISIRDARWLFQHHIVNHVRNVEPVQVFHEGIFYWLVWLSNCTYELLDINALSKNRDDGTPRPLLTNRFMYWKTANERGIAAC